MISLPIIIGLGINSVMARTFTKAQISSQSWQSQLTSETSLLACSMACRSSFSTCNIFMWKDSSICYRGTVTKAILDTPDPLDTAYVDVEVLKATQALAALNPDPLYVFRNLAFFKSRSDFNFQGAKDFCATVGATLITPHTEETWNFLTTQVLEKDIKYWVGMDSVATINCENDACNSQMTWVDGKSFVYENFFDCVFINEANAELGMRLGHKNVEWNGCNDNNEDGWVLTDTNETTIREFFCQLEV